MEGIVNNIFSIKAESFTEIALEIFNYQYLNNNIYKQWVDVLKVDVKNITVLEDIPFMPIRFFKSYQVKTTEFKPEVVFESSGTTSTTSSRHYVKSSSIYERSFMKGFEHFYGAVDNYCFIGLLPSYLERSGSSLVMMVDEMIRQSKHPLSGFYLYDYKNLFHLLQELEAKGTKTILIGVTFALIDFAQQFPLKLQHTIVMETGGMKGRRKEMLREEVHTILKGQFGVEYIHSEYGMTELLSQAYSSGDGKFLTPPWMKVMVRDEEDPLSTSANGTGLINVIDLANIYSCSFIATDDVGIINSTNFEVIGRLDNSDLRGCSLLVA